MRSTTPTAGSSSSALRRRDRRSLAPHSRSRKANHVRRAPSEKWGPRRVLVVRFMSVEGVEDPQHCQGAKMQTTETSTRSFGKTVAVDMLAVMATFAERVAHALKTREKNARALELALNRRFGKKETSSGYVHRVLHKGLQPTGEVISAMAEILEVSE